MQTEKWLTINQSGAAKMTSSRPRMNVDEISLLLGFDIPDALFTKPKFVAEIKVPDTAVTPEQVATVVTDNIEDAIKSVTGLEMRVSVVEPPEEP